MLNIIARTARICIVPLESVHIKLVAVAVRRYASFSVREILNERSDESGTLLTRFAKHIALEGIQCLPAVATTVRYPDYFPVTDMRYFQAELRRTPPEQLPALITFAFNYRPSADPIKFALILNDLDAAAIQLLSKMDENTILRTLYAFLFLMPNWMTRLDFYHAALQQLVKQNLENTSREKFIQLCFYLGLAKKQKTSHMLQQLLQPQLEQLLPQLTTMDLAVVASAAYKTSTVVQNVAYNEKLLEQLLELPLDGTQDALLVTFIKAARLQRIKSVRVCEHLESVCSNEHILGQLQSRAIVHLFAYFAENLWDKDECTAPLIATFMKRLARANRPQSYEEAIRGKDIAMFLWSCGQLDCSLSASDMQRIDAVLMAKLNHNEFDYFSDQLIDSCLSLWLLGHKSRQLLQESVNLKLQVGPNHRQPKVESRLTVLLAAAAIEEPTWKFRNATLSTPFDMGAAVPAYLLKGNPSLTKSVSELSKVEGIAEVKLCCPIDGINIPSLLVRPEIAIETPIFVELLTDAQTLHFSGKPAGILRLKARLLTALDHKVIVLRESDIETEKGKDFVLSAIATTVDQKEQSVSSI